MAMKKLVLLGLLVCALNMNMHAQHHFNSGGGRAKYGGVIFAGGVLFTVVGVTTGSEVTYTNGNISNGTPNTVPFYEQTARFACIVTGVTLTVTGLITMLVERKR
jgi:hypothetical protein